MSIAGHAGANFQILLRAAGDKNRALMECSDAVNGEPRYVICAVGRDGSNFVFKPFGHLANGNPYDAYLPPSETLPSGSSTDPVAAEPVWARRFAGQRASRSRIARRAIRDPRSLAAPGRQSAATRGSGGDERCAGF